MRSSTTKAWFLVHKWTSLVCTVFLLMLCVTGLPLIFYEEIDHATGAAPEVAAAAPGATPAPLDGLVAKALAANPGHVPLFFAWDDHEPAIYITTGPKPDAAPAQMKSNAFHAFTGDHLPMPDFTKSVMFFLYRLHTDMFLGIWATFFLGAMTLVFAASIVSGLVVYGPFMRKLEFGTLRTSRSARLKWLDLHNLLGVVTAAWALVVGVTGAINTVAQPLQNAWQAQELGAFAKRYEGQPAPTALASLDAAVTKAKAAAAPGMVPAYVSYPGTGFSGQHHYGIYMHAEHGLGERLYQPVLVDARTGELAGQPKMPAYMQVLILSQPLHFGDYGGLPLKVIWAVLDLVTIVVLGSGLYLWLAKRSPASARVREIETGGAVAPAE